MLISSRKSLTLQDPVKVRLCKKSDLKNEILTLQNPDLIKRENGHKLKMYFTKMCSLYLYCIYILYDTTSQLIFAFLKEKILTKVGWFSELTADHSHFTNWSLYSCIVITLHWPQGTVSKSIMSELTMTSGTATLARKRTQIWGPETT